MGQRGPAAKPSILHLVNGNPSKKKLVSPEKKPFLEVKLPPAPKELQGEARKEWRRMGSELVKVGMMTALDKPAFVLYCLAWERLVLLQRELNGRLQQSENIVDALSWSSDKTGYEQKSVLVQLLEGAQKDVYSYMQQFGLSPSSRARLESVMEKHQAQMGLDFDQQSGIGSLAGD